MEELKSQRSPRNKKRTNRKKTLFLIIAVLCLAVAMGAGVYIIDYYSTLNRNNELYEALQSQVAELPETPIPPEPSVEETEEAATIEEELEEAMARAINFDILTADVNEDIYAWIYIPDTNINYPMLQHATDDSYYLNYNLDGTKGYPGCIYTEKRNEKDFTDFNTVIYGHNMKNGSMFHDLHNYEEEGFLEEHPYVYIYTKDKTLKYQIFAAYQYDDRHLLYSFDYASDAGRERYLEEILNIQSVSAVLDESMELDTDSNIITLSTCVGGQSTQRYLVQAALLSETEAPLAAEQETSD